MAPSHGCARAINGIVRERLVRDGAVHGPRHDGRNASSRAAIPAPRRPSPPTTSPETRSRSTAPTSVSGSGRATSCASRASIMAREPVNLEGRGRPVRRVGAQSDRGPRGRRRGIPRRGDRAARRRPAIRWTRNDAGLGLVNSGTAEVAAVRGGHVTFPPSRTGARSISPPAIRSSAIVDRAWASTVHAFQGRTVDTVISPRWRPTIPTLTTQKSFYVEISARATARSSSPTTGRRSRSSSKPPPATHRGARSRGARAGEGPRPRDGWESGVRMEGSGESVSRDRDRSSGPELEPGRGGKGVDRDFWAIDRWKTESGRGHT